MKRKRWISQMIVSAAAVAVMPPLLAPLSAAPAEADSATSAPALSVADPVTMLTDTTKTYTQSQRDEAARRLLSRHADDARAVLRNALISPDIGAQLAVARALEGDPNPDPAFIDPLFPLLANSAMGTNTGKELATVAARALAGYKASPAVLTRLIVTSSARRNTTEYTRIAAIRAIGSMPERRAASQLIDLLRSPDESSAVHAAAADSLVEMNGLEQNGRDPARWTDWWNGQQNKNDNVFRQDIIAHQQTQLAILNAHLHALDSAVETILRDQYHAADPDQQHRLALSFLQSSEPEIREIGTRLISDDVIESKPPSAPELVQLRDMVADSSPAVRRAVADTISKLNDPASLDALLAQLQTEPDPSVRAAIAIALGPIQDPQQRAVPTLIKLLGDDSLPTAEAAARALAIRARGPLANDAAKNRETADALRDTILHRSGTAGAEDLVASCIDAIAPLNQPDVVRQLVDAKMLDPNHQGKAVRQAMVRAVGELRDPRLDGLIQSSVKNDPDEDVQVDAIRALAKNPSAANYAQDIGDLLKPEESRKDSVRAEAWVFLQGVFPQLKEAQLSQWENRFKDDPPKHLVVLKALRDKQKSSNEMPDLAITESQIGDVYKSLRQYDSAAEHFREALNIYNADPEQAASARFNNLERSYMQVLLDGKSFAEAIDFAALRIKADPREQKTMGPLIYSEALSLSTPGPNANLPNANLKAAQDLLKRAQEMHPPLDDIYRGWLQDIASRLPAKTSSNDNGALPQSATVDGKD